MNYTVLIGAVGVAVVGVAIWSYNGTPGDQVMTRAAQEAAENAPQILTENNTQPNETVTQNVADSAAGPNLDVTAEAAGEAPADAELLTVEGYDSYRVRLMLAETDMLTETRNTYLQRLERALGDDDMLGAILAELRAEIDATSAAPRTVAVETARAEETAPRNNMQANEVNEGIADIEAILSAHDGPTADVVNDEVALDARTITPEDATRPSFIAETLSPDAFEAERVVALIQAAPRLTDAEKAQLQAAIQAVVDVPDVRPDVLGRLEKILLTLS